MERKVIESIIRITRRELVQWRDSMVYGDLEVFIGCVLADLKMEHILTDWEESIIRQKLLEE